MSHTLTSICLTYAFQSVSCRNIRFSQLQELFVIISMNCMAIGVWSCPPARISKLLFVCLKFSKSIKDVDSFFFGGIPPIFFIYIASITFSFDSLVWRRFVVFSSRILRLGKCLRRTFWLLRCYFIRIGFIMYDVLKLEVVWYGTWIVRF